MTKTQSTPQAVSLDEIKPGMIIAFKRYRWSKVRTAMIVKSVDRMCATYIYGDRYRVTTGTPGIGTTSAMFVTTESPEIILIGSVA